MTIRTANTIKGIVFDKDGVLLQLLPSWLPAAQALARECVKIAHRVDSSLEITEKDILGHLGIHEDKMDLSHIFAGGSQADICHALQQAVPALSESLGSLQEQQRLETLMLNEKPDHTPLGDVAGTLAILRQQGYQLMVLTNDSMVMAHASLQAIGVWDAFDAVMTADQGHGGKPNATGLLAMIEAQNLKRHEVVVVGDTCSDRKVAQNAEISYFVGISEAFPKATVPLTGCTYLLPDISDLPDLLPRITA